MISKNNLIQKLIKEEYFESVDDTIGENGINHLSNHIDDMDLGFLVHFDEVNDGNYYTIGSYWSDKLQQSIILDWGVEMATFKDFFNELVRLEKIAKKTEKSFLMKKNTFYFIDDEAQTLRVSEFEGTPKKFEEVYREFSKDFNSDEGYHDFYKKLAKKTKSVIDEIEIEFYH